MPKTQEEFDHQRQVFAEALSSLNGAFIRAFPDGYIFDPGADPTRITGTAYDEPLRSIASKIYDVMICFDLMQECFGLPPGEPPRFKKFLEGGCND